jgi:hypothetical protein
MRDLIILGTGPSHWQCPSDVGHAEVWGLNGGFQQAQAKGLTLSKLFLCHRQVYSPDGNPYFDWDALNQLPCEIITLHKVPIAKAKMYPLRRISETFHTRYFSNTISYMIAYALYKRGFDRIRLYGIDMLEHGEYAQEKGGVEFWLGVARGMGLDFTISYGSAVCQTVTGAPYGFRAKGKLKKLDPYGLLGREPLKRGGLVGALEITGNLETITAKDLIGGLPCRLHR